jgi:hypothetical protein
MAAVTYRCPVDPTGCGDYSGPGYCDRHPTSTLEQVRAPLPPPPVAEADAGTPAAPPPAAARASLAVSFRGRTFPVAATGLVLGREEGPLSTVPGMSELTQVSRRHATLSWLGDVLYISDDRSTNGTYVDGVKVETPRRIAPGQRLRLALDVELELAAEELDEFGLPR